MDSRHNIYLESRERRNISRAIFECALGLCLTMSQHHECTSTGILVFEASFVLKGAVSFNWIINMPTALFVSLS